MPDIGPRAYVTRRRAGNHSASVQLAAGGPTMCRRAAEFVLGVSAQRVQRVLRGDPDRRAAAYRLPAGHPANLQQPTQLCLRFLWRKYHYDAEGMPDRFDFGRGDLHTRTIGDATDPLENYTARASEAALEDRREDEKRQIGRAALVASVLPEPAATAVLGPGLQWGPPRYLGVLRPVHLYQARNRLGFRCSRPCSGSRV